MLCDVLRVCIYYIYLDTCVFSSEPEYIWTYTYIIGCISNTHSFTKMSLFARMFGMICFKNHGPKLGAPPYNILQATGHLVMNGELHVMPDRALIMFFPNRHCWHQSTHKIHQCSTSSIHFSGLMHSTVTMVWGGVPHTKYQCRLPRIMTKGWTESEKENWLKQISLGKKNK